MASIRCAFSLACCIGSMSMACGSLAMIGGNSEKISFQRGLFLTSLSFVYFISLSDFLNKFFTETRIGQQFQVKYKLLKSDLMDISNKLVSAIQAMLSCTAGFIVCRSSCRVSFLSASHMMSDTYAWFGTAYFLYDLWSMYKVHVQKIADKLKLLKLSLNNDATKQRAEHNDDADDANDDNENKNKNGLYDKLNGLIRKKSTTEIVDDNHDCDSIQCDWNVYVKKYAKKMEKIPLEEITFLQYCLKHPVMTFHHMFLVSLGLMAVVYLRGNSGDCVFGFVYMMELSTPFVSFRSILSILDLKHTKMYVINGLIMVFLFFICRVLIGPYVLYLYMEIVNLSAIQTLISLSPICKLISMFLFLPQFYWFYLMVKGALQVFFPKSKRISLNELSNKMNGNIPGEMNAELPNLNVFDKLS